MKIALFVSFLLLPFCAIAQLYPKHVGRPDNTVDVSGKIEASYSGSIKFKGNGAIPDNLAMTNWSWLHFKAEDELTVKGAISFAENSQEIIIDGNVRFAKISMHGADTIYVRTGLCRIDNITSENSVRNGWNTIVVNEGAELFIEGMEIRTGDNNVTISTTGAPDSKIKITKGADNRLGMGH